VEIDLLVDEEEFAERNGIEVDEARRSIVSAADAYWSHLYVENSSARHITVTEPAATWLVIGPGVYGSGLTLTEAKANYQRHGGRLQDRPQVYHFGTRSIYAGVDEVGRIHWYGDEPERMK
jgi:hypothetical protein